MEQRVSSRLAIIGAGSVGASTAYAALIRGSAQDIRLYDVDAQRAAAEVLDLAHGGQFAGTAQITGGAEMEHLEGADVVIITAGAKQKPGQTRLDLAATNVGILRDLLPEVVRRSPQAVCMIVTNPCDVLTVAAREFTGLPPSRIFSSGTVLDTARLRWLLAERAGVARSSVHANIVGEHGDSEFPVWSTATIGSTPISEWESDGHRVFTQEILDEVAEDVRTAAYRVIQGKGATNYAIGLSAVRIAEAVLNDESAILPVSTVMDGPWELSDVALSVPSIVSSAGVTPLTSTPMSAEEQEKLRRSAEDLKGVQRSLGLPG